MQNTMKGYLEQLTIGEIQSFKNLALFPLLSGYRSPVDYLVLDEALKAGVIDVTEVDKGGSVPELKVINKSPSMVLILDGEELVGAKQNRIVNTTILIQGNSTIVIPVTCVEQGRWSYASSQFYSEERILSSELRSMKANQVNISLKEQGEFAADQCKMWDGIEEKASRRGAKSASMAMAEIYKKDLPSLEEYAGHFTVADSQLGALFLINGGVVGLESFGKPETFARVFQKLVQSYALDAIDWFDEKKEFSVPEGIVPGFLEQIRGATIETHPSVALGTDCRLDSEGVTGFGFEFNDQLLHLSVFSKRNESRREERGARMERPSRRRRNGVE
jgi:hypothetical protein